MLLPDDARPPTPEPIEPGTRSVRQSFDADLDQLRLQIELMSVLVREALIRMRTVLATGDHRVAALAVAADDDVDAMHVSLTERCYDLIRREQPVASDLRFLVSVLRVVEELERIADLSLRVVKQVDAQPLLAAHGAVFAILEEMAEAGESLFRTAVDAWTGQDERLAATLEVRSRMVDGHYDALVAHLCELDGPGATNLAVVAVLVGQALERIADHTVIVGDRLRYLLTADPVHLASEVR